MTQTAVRLATDLIQKHEGCRLHPYQDIAGNWTIGWGCRYLSDGSRVGPHTPPMSQDQADSIMSARLNVIAGEVDALLPDGVTDNQRAALYDFAWNVGVNALARSHLLQYLKDGDTAHAADEFSLWIYAGDMTSVGLQQRRAEEAELFLSGDVETIS